MVSVAPSGEVRSGGEIARFDRVIVCAGRDTAALAGLISRCASRPTPASRIRCASRRRWPAFRTAGRGAYGEPLPGNERYAIGLGDGDPVEYVAERLPGLEPRAVEARTCWVTELPWGHDGVAVWEAGVVQFVAGNNLFKHAPALGRRLAVGDVEELRPEVRLGTSTAAE